MSMHAAKSLKTLEAGTGIEPVFTDLQSIRFRRENNDVDRKEYQDKSGSGGEPDTPPVSGANSENENPGALAGATGDQNKAASFKREHYRNRAGAATALCHAIAECDPADACEIMEAAYGSLRAGMPIAPFDGIMEEAAFWADFATRQELKAYCLACYRSMSASDQAAFLAYVRGAA